MSVCETCSEIQCPKTENLSLKLWSTRAISSFTLVGAAVAPTNASPAFGAGNIPAFKRAWAFGSSRVLGMVLLGNAAALSTLPLASHVLSGTPAAAKLLATVVDTAFEQGVCRPELPNSPPWLMAAARFPL